MTARIGVAFDGFSTTAEAIAVAKRAVDSGAQSLWMAEHLGYREAITTCAAFALQAPGPMLVPTAVSPYLWHATPTAMALATLDELAPGKVAVALGVGNPLFLQESGQKLEKPIPAMREFIEAMRKLWSTEPIAQGWPVRSPRRRQDGVQSKSHPDLHRRDGSGHAEADGTHRRRGCPGRRPSPRRNPSRRSLALCAEGAAKQGRDISTFRSAGYTFLWHLEQRA